MNRERVFKIVENVAWFFVAVGSVLAMVLIVGGAICIGTA